MIGRIRGAVRGGDSLTEAMARVRQILAGPPHPAPAVRLRPPGPGDLGWVVQAHGALYAAEYGWDETFEALVARIVADYAAEHDPQRERAWLAEVEGRPAGWSRQASTEIGTLPPSGAWVTVFSNVCGWMATENPAASGLPSSDGVSAQ